jgi:uncharacterized protein YecE (DUF72 family)
VGRREKTRVDLVLAHREFCDKIFSAAMEKSKIAVGCQSWTYDDWVTRPGGETSFYPRGTRPAEMLETYAEVFETIEVDSTVYGVPSGTTVKKWYDQTPENFIFSLKLPNEITHKKGLSKNSFPVLKEFCGRALELKEKLGAVLILLSRQFEPSTENQQRLREFLSRLPREIRFAIEFRDPAWLVDWTFEELEKYRVALCLVEGKWIPREINFAAVERSLADFAYIRFRGERDLLKFDRIYRPQNANLQIWKEEIEKLKANEIYVYFSNFYEGHAPASANKLKKLLGQKTVDPSELEKQGSLF